MAVEEKKSANPYYVALVILGILFAVTASAYGVMMLVSIREAGMAITAGPSLADQHPMMQFMDQHGFRLMLWELGLLALATVLVITTDSLRERRAEASESSGHRPAGGKS